MVGRAVFDIYVPQVLPGVNGSEHQEASLMDVEYNKLHCWPRAEREEKEKKEV